MSRHTFAPLFHAAHRNPSRTGNVDDVVTRLAGDSSMGALFALLHDQHAHEDDGEDRGLEFEDLRRHEPSRHRARRRF